MSQDWNNPDFQADIAREAMQADHKIEELQAQVAKLTSDLAEADRRAGAAERTLASTKEDVYRFESCRRGYKRDWGVEDLVSFDDVWDEALALKRKFDDAVSCTVSERIRTAVAYANLEIPLATDTLEFVARDTNASPELRSDACRAIAGLTRLKARLPAALGSTGKVQMCRRALRGPSPT